MRTTRRHAIALSSAMVAVLTGCLPRNAAGPGNRIVFPPTPAAADDDLIPRHWKTTTVGIGAGLNALSALHFIQQLQIPRAQIPFVQSMTFYVPKDIPLVTIGLYYERSDQSRAARAMLTGGAFALQEITDPDSPLSYDPAHVKTVKTENLTQDQMAWFGEHRQEITDAMKSSAEGKLLGSSYDCDFTTRARPPAGTPAALVVAGGNYLGVHIPDTIIAQTILFSG